MIENFVPHSDVNLQGVRHNRNSNHIGTHHAFNVSSILGGNSGAYDASSAFLDYISRSARVTIVVASGNSGSSMALQAAGLNVIAVGSNFIYEQFDLPVSGTYRIEVVMESDKANPVPVIPGYSRSSSVFEVLILVLYLSRVVII